jgi:hypothetical protein
MTRMHRTLDPWHPPSAYISSGKVDSATLCPTCRLPGPAHSGWIRPAGPPEQRIIRGKTRLVYPERVKCTTCNGSGWIVVREQTP